MPLPALLNDILLYSGALVTVELAGIGLFAHVMAISLVIFTRAGQLFSGLEDEVAERTAELRARERELSGMLESRRRILDAIPDTVCLLDGSRIDYVNEAGATFFGTSAAGLTGTAFTRYEVEEQAPEAERCLAAITRSTRPTFPVELRLQRPDRNRGYRPRR